MFPRPSTRCHVRSSPMWSQNIRETLSGCVVILNKQKRTALLPDVKQLLSHETCHAELIAEMINAPVLVHSPLLGSLLLTRINFTEHVRTIPLATCS